MEPLANLFHLLYRMPRSVLIGAHVFGDHKEFPSHDVYPNCTVGAAWGSFNGTTFPVGFTYAEPNVIWGSYLVYEDHKNSQIPKHAKSIVSHSLNFMEG